MRGSCRSRMLTTLIPIALVTATAGCSILGVGVRRAQPEPPFKSSRRPLGE